MLSIISCVAPTTVGAFRVSHNRCHLGCLLQRHLLLRNFVLSALAACAILSSAIAAIDSHVTFALKLRHRYNGGGRTSGGNIFPQQHVRCGGTPDATASGGV